MRPRPGPANYPLHQLTPPPTFDPLELGPHCEWIPPRNIHIPITISKRGKEYVAIAALDTDIIIIRPQGARRAAPLPVTLTATAAADQPAAICGLVPIAPRLSKKRMPKWENAVPESVGSQDTACDNYCAASLQGRHCNKPEKHK